MPGAPRSTKQSRHTTNNLVALGSAAVLAVYATGFVKTRAAAARFADESNVRRPATPSDAAPERAALSTAQAAIAEAAVPVANVRDSAANPTLTRAVKASSAAPLTTRDAAPTTTVGATIVGATPVKSATTAAPTTNSASLTSAVAELPVRGSTSAVATSTTVPTTASIAATAASAVIISDSAPVHVATPVAETAPAPVEKKRAGYADGVYYGWGTSRHGDIQAEVEIQGGRIASARIAQCLTRYSCSWIAMLPGQVTSRQSPDVDYVSGATQSSNAFYYAVVDALLKAK